MSDFSIDVSKKDIPGIYQFTHWSWIIASVLTKTTEGGEECKIPGWAGFNPIRRFLQENISLTLVHCLYFQKSPMTGQHY